MPGFLELWLQSLPRLLRAAVEVTIPLSLISFAIALVVAVVVALVRLYGPAPLKALAWAYVQVFRGTPLVVQLFIVYFGLPSLGISLDAFPAAVVTLALNTGAYASEAVRASILSIPRGQFEAAQTLNLSRATTFRRVVAPQAMRIVLPPLANDFIDLVKGTSLVFAITLVDLFQVGRQVAGSTFEPMAMYTLVALIYLVMVSLLSLGQNVLEKKVSAHVRS
ncbi:amino acid ABC transporter permease [Brachybacterium sp. p3-SID1565]|uniref:amino acid ABC transporter permease n=1 Tax=unclassified Brachybacterium TaxID=2623841 RepID=UPI0021A9FBEA|nr:MULTISPECIES: amino acid ABC transporter permease [unclassified Brachybacterium]MCT1386297.1 amino acid ABC transporter permease [Brachybacterium sp. p3-SID1565]MCT1775905.1 amino acid ABC transporter permease [Brachybacterium sp. p3-SID957]